MSNRFVTTALAGAFLVSGLILLAVGYIGSKEMDRLRADARGIAQNEWGDVQLASEALDYSNQSSRIDLEALNTTNPSEVEYLFLERSQNSAKVSALLQQLQTRVGSEEEQKLLNAVTGSRNAYLKSVENLRELLLVKNDPAEARTFTQKVVSPLFRQYHATWSDFERFQADEMNRVLDESEIKNAAAKKRTVRLIVLAILLTLATMVFVTRKITVEINMRARAEKAIRLMNDDLEYQVAYRTGALNQANKELWAEVAERKKMEQNLRSKTAFLVAQLDSTPDGILVVDAQGQIVLRNKRFLDLWQVPQPLGEQTSDASMVEYATSTTKNPEQFFSKVKYLYDHPGETSRDEVELKDGTVLDRYSSPVIGKDGEYYGRIWNFRDITERKRNEDTLRQLSLAVEQSPVSVVITDHENNISYVNQKFAEVTGYQPEEVLGKNPRILNAGLTTTDVYRDLWTTLNQGGEWHGEFCNRRKSGEIFWEAATIRRITNEKGAIVHYLAVKEDITERRRSEEEVRASRQMLQSILDAIPQRVFWKDKDCVYLGCNRPFAADAGLDTPAAIVGKTDSDLSWSAVAEKYRTDDRRVMERRTPKLNFHERQERLDGSELWLQTNKKPLLDLHGEVIGVLGTYEDITEQKKAEKDLRLMKFCLDNASDSVFWIDRDGHIVYANRAACRSLKRSREELVSLLISDIDPTVQQKWPGIWEKLKTRSVINLESQNKGKDGRIFPVEITADYLEFDGQEYSFAFVRDVSARRELETQLRQAQKLEAIGQLAAGIAHEINTPAQYVGDNTTFLKESWELVVPLLNATRQMRVAAESGTLTDALFEDFDHC